jgi:hypothetical protein
LQKHSVEDQLYAIITDNARNNSKAYIYLESFCRSHTPGNYIPCLARLLHLSLGNLLSDLDTQLIEDENEYLIEFMATSVDLLSSVALVVAKVISVQAQVMNTC